MALLITDACISCGVCAPLCPAHAIARAGDRYAIDGERCTECVGARAVPECADVCPAECCLPDPARPDSRVSLARRARRLAATTATLALALLGGTVVGTGCGRKAEGPAVVEMATVPSPPETGEVHFVVNVHGVHGGALKGRAVDLAASIPPRPPLPEMNVTGVASEARGGRYDAVLNLAARGHWSVVVTVRRERRVEAERTFTVDVR